MSDSRQRLADHFEAGQADLELLLRARGRDEIARLMRHLLQWRRELIALAKDHDPVALHFFIVWPEPQEMARIRRWYPELRDSQRNVCNYVEAALVRLNPYLRQPVARPKRPGRKKGEKLHDDSKEIAEARQLMAGPNPPSMHKAAWAVVGPIPKGASRKADFRRIYNVLRGV